VLRDNIKKILNEIKFSPERAEELKTKFGWKFVQTDKPKKTDKFKNKRVYTFKSPKYKYIVHIEEYDYDYFLVSFFPKLNKDFFVKQQKLASGGQKHFDKYSYQTKENIPFKIFSLLINEIKDILKEKPYASFGYFGSPDYMIGDDTDLINTKRFRIYNKSLQDEFSETHTVLGHEMFAGGLVLNKEVLEEYPEFEDYCRDILISHI
jgi:hypothetical protein